MSHCLFFPDLVPATAIRRKAFGPVLKKMTATWSPPFLIYPAVIKLRTKENREASIPSESGGFYQFHVSAEVLCRLFGGTTGEQRPLFLSVQLEGRDGLDDLALAAQKGMIAGWPWMLAKPIFCVFLLLILGYCPYLSGTTISLLVRLTLHFSVWRGLMESRFNY